MEVDREELIRMAKAMRSTAKKLDEFAKAMEPDLFEDKPKPKAKAGDEKNPFGILRLTWLDYYEKEKEVKYYFQPKDGAALKRIIAKIRYMSEKELTRDEVEISFGIVLKKLKDADLWIWNHLSLTILDSKFNEVVAKIKEGGESDYASKLNELL